MVLYILLIGGIVFQEIAIIQYIGNKLIHKNVHLNTIFCQTAVCYIHSTILQTLSWLATVPWLDRQEIGRQDYKFQHLKRFHKHTCQPY